MPEFDQYDPITTLDGDELMVWLDPAGTRRMTAADLKAAVTTTLPTTPDPALILYSQDVPAAGATHYTANAASWATLPFDGLAVYSVVGADGVFNRTTALASGTVATEWSGFHSAAWGPMTQHWPLIRIQFNVNGAGTGGGDVPDFWNDTHWATICANVRTFVAGVKGPKVAGFLLDNEHYHSVGASLFDWVNGGGIDPTHTLSQSQAKVRQRGQEFMAAILEAWPEAQVVLAHGPYISDPKTGTDIWTNQVTDPPYWNNVSSSNELSAWFTWGMGTATVGTAGKVHDGGEVYAARTPEHMARVRRWQLGMATTPGTIVPSDLRGPEYPLGAVQAVYDRDQFAGFAAHSLPSIRAMLTSAMRTSSPMVWFYMETWDPFPGGLPGNTDQSWKPHLPAGHKTAIDEARTAGRDVGHVRLNEQIVRPEEDGAVGDTRIVRDGAMTNASTTLTSATAAFVAGDVGKTVAVGGAGAVSFESNRQALVTTISSVTNGTTVVLAAAAQATVSGAALAIGTNDTTALQTWLDRAGPNTELRATPGKVYMHTGVLLLGHETVEQQARADAVVDIRNALLLATTDSASAFKVKFMPRLTLRGGLFELIHRSGRGNTENHEKCYVQSCTNFKWLDAPMAVNSSAASFLLLGVTGFYVDGPTSWNSRADAFHMTGGSAWGEVRNVTSVGQGDDGVAVVSYDSAPVCHDINVVGAYVRYPRAAGRGLAVVGGENIRFANFDVEGTRQAGLYVACEPGFSSHGCRNIEFNGGRVARCVLNPAFDHGQFHVYNGRAGFTIDNVRLAGINFHDSGAAPTGKVAFRLDRGGGTGGTISNIHLGYSDEEVRLTGWYYRGTFWLDAGTSFATQNVTYGPRTNFDGGQEVRAKTATHTLELDDMDALVPINAAGATNWTIPTNASVALPVGSSIDGAQLGAGLVTITGPGVTLIARGSALKSAGQGARWNATKTGTDTWLVVGDLVP